MSFAEIEKGIGELALKARNNKLSIADMSGGTFTISNGGTYGSLLSTPILNPPQSGILGMHKIMDRAVVIDGKVEVRPMMYLALSYDHRIIDGKEAVTFLVAVKDLLEDEEEGSSESTFTEFSTLVSCAVRLHALAQGCNFFSLTAPSEQQFSCFAEMNQCKQERTKMVPNKLCL